MGLEKVRIDRLTRKRFMQVVRSFRASDTGGKGQRLFCLLITLMVVIGGLNVLNSYVGRNFMSAIEQRQAADFTQQAILYVLVFAVTTVAAVWFRFCEERLGLLWRESLTRHLTRAYLKHSLRSHGAEKVANPDQRIAEDVKSFTTTTLSFVLLLLNGTFTVIAFSGVLWSISALLFLVAVLYASVGTFMAIRLGRPLIGLNFRQSDKEANFRSELVHLREHADEVAITHNEPLFESRLSQRIGDWAANARRIISVNRNLSFFTTGYNYGIQILPALIVAPLFFAGKVEFGVITQSAMAFTTLLGAFSLIVTQFQSISTFAAVITRLSELATSIENAAERPKAASIEIRREPRRLRFEALDLLAPDTGLPLVRGLELIVPERANMLVNGTNGPARHALFHLLAGDWERGEGAVVMPDENHLMLLPERPYLPTGTLRQILHVEGGDFRINDLRTSQAIRQLGLTATITRVGGLDVVREWGEVLSLEEQQLVSCVRAIAANPDFIIFDRPGTTLKKDELARVLTTFRRMGQGSVTFGGSGEAYEVFDAVLKINPDATWTYAPQIRAVPEELFMEDEEDLPAAATECLYGPAPTHKPVTPTPIADEDEDEGNTGKPPAKVGNR